MLSPRLRSTLRQMKVKQKSHRSTVASVKTCFRTPSYTDALMHMEQQESINLCKNFSSQKICSYHSIEKCLNVRPEALQQGRQRLAHQILESLHIRRCYGLIVLIWESLWNQLSLGKRFPFFPSLKVWFMRVSFLNDTACSVPGEVSCQVALCILAVIDARSHYP